MGRGDERYGRAQTGGFERRGRAGEPIAYDEEVRLDFPSPARGRWREAPEGGRDHSSTIL
jgi:hypothetical protein